MALTTAASSKSPPALSSDDDASPSPSKRAKATNAAVAAGKNKKQALVHAMFGKQHDSIGKDIEFVMKNTSVTTLEGYLKVKEEIDELHTDINAVADINDFETANGKKAELEVLLKGALLEKKLHDKCKWEIEHAKEYHRKRENFREAGKNHKLLLVATEYLESQPSEDFDGFATEAAEKTCRTTEKTNEAAVDLTGGDEEKTEATEN